MKIEIYSDIACPWCYIGQLRFERALRAFPQAEQVEVSYRPYQLDPAAPEPSVPMMPSLERRFGPQARAMVDRVAENARSEGVQMDFDRALAANTLDAHRLMELAGSEYGAEVQRDLAEALFRAHFTEGRDVAARETLVELATATGMDEARTRDFLVSDEGRHEVREQIEHAQRLGITSVPTFVFDAKYAVQGAQPTSAFLQALEQVAQESGKGKAAEEDGSCADGACEL